MSRESGAILGTVGEARTALGLLLDRQVWELVAEGVLVAEREDPALPWTIRRAPVRGNARPRRPAVP